MTEAIIKKEKTNTNPTQNSLAETMGKTLSTKDTALAAAVSGGSKKSLNKNSDPNLITLNLDNFETKLGKKRL